MRLGHAPSDAPVKVAKPSRKADALLAYLALNPGIIHERSKLMDMFCFKVRDPAGDLRGILKRAREMVGKGITEQYYTISNVNGDNAVRFAPTPLLHIDVVEFRKPLAPSVSIDDLVNRIKLCCGPFMPGYDGLDSVGWLEQTRAGLESQFGMLMKRLLDMLYNADRWEDVATWAEHWVACSGWRPDAYRDLSLAYSELGDLSGLEDVYKRYTHALIDLGVKPPEDIQREYAFRHKAITESLSAPRPARREAAQQPQATPSPSSKQTEPPKPKPPKPLPEQTTSFIGRANDLAKIANKLADMDCRLLTLVGIGGVGKTRLALQAAQQAAPAYADGVCLVGLGQVRTDEALLASLANALNFVPYGQELLQAQLQNYLREKRLLLVLDSFEHVLTEWDSATEAIQVLEELLTTAPGLKVLVTSRQRLRLVGEHVLSVEGLDYPVAVDDDVDGVAKIENYSAIKLFMRTARRMRPEFDLRDERAGVVRICQRAEGLPLAIDLAAVHVAGMSASDIADEIDKSLDVLQASGAFSADEDPRHRSVRATFEYSWRMMTAEEQRAFAQLSAFVGSFSREAAQRVVDAPQRVLSGLVSNSLLHYDFKASRYDVHDLLRQFAAEKLHDASLGLSNPALFTRLSDYYLSFARRNQKRYDMLEPEWANFLVAMRVAHAHARWQTLIEYAEALGDTWFTRARFSDARVGFALAVQAAMQAEDEPAIARFWQQQGRSCIEQGDYDEAAGYLNRSLDLCQQLADERGIADAQYGLARIAFERGQLAESEQRLAACRQLREALKDVWGIAEAMHGLAKIAFGNRSYPEAIQLDKSALDLLSGEGEVRTIHSKILCYLAISHGYIQDYESAKTYSQKMLEVCQELQDEGEYAIALYTLSEVCLRTNDLNAAYEHGERCANLLRRMGDRKTLAHITFHLCTVEYARHHFEAAVRFGRQSLDMYKTMNDERSMVRPYMFVGDSLNKLQDSESAKQAWLEGLGIASRMGHPQADALKERLKETTDLAGVSAAP
jgi:predicted ATPase/DNA-binding SARP family transcriptional activator